MKFYHLSMCVKILLLLCFLIERTKTLNNKVQIIKLFCNILTNLNQKLILNFVHPNKRNPVSLIYLFCGQSCNLLDNFFDIIYLDE